MLANSWHFDVTVIILAPLFGGLLSSGAALLDDISDNNLYLDIRFQHAEVHCTAPAAFDASESHYASRRAHIITISALYLPARYHTHKMKSWYSLDFFTAQRLPYATYARLLSYYRLLARVVIDSYYFDISDANISL